MSNQIPFASSCHHLQLPPTEKDDRYNLNVRTGSASTLYNSFVFSHGGLTIGLEFRDHTIPEILKVFQLQIRNSKSANFESYLSQELFCLSLIDKAWIRIPTKLKPPARFLHEIAAANNMVYLFGGLQTTTDNKLQPLNDLWQFNLESKQWKILHDGKGWETNPAIPKPRFNHKMTAILNLSFVSKRGHYGILIAGGKDSDSTEIYENAVFDLVTNKYVGNEPLYLNLKPDSVTLDYFKKLNPQNHLNINYTDSVIVTVSHEVEHEKRSLKSNRRMSVSNPALADEKRPSVGGIETMTEESIVVYSPVLADAPQDYLNPLLLFKLGRTIKTGKMLPTPRSTQWINNKRMGKTIDKQEYITIDSEPASNDTNDTSIHTIPLRLRYPCGGIFGKNLVITGFLQNDYDISIFVYNNPTGKWSRLNVFCNHDYGSHRFWGGFAWQSHHKVVLLGNYVTLQTTSSIRFFTQMITVSLPITNILASSDLAGEKNAAPPNPSVSANSPELEPYNLSSNLSKINLSSTTSEEDTFSSSYELSSDTEEEKHDQESEDAEADTEPTRHAENAEKSISFSEYVHYVAPKNNMSTIRSVFPPAAVALGRNAFERYGDLAADFEIVSCNGDRIPVALKVLSERWGRYFIDLLSRGYLQAVNSFERQQSEGLEQKHHQLLIHSSGSVSASQFGSFMSNSIHSSISKGSFGSRSSALNEDDKKKSNRYQRLEGLAYDGTNNIAGLYLSPGPEQAPAETSKPPKQQQEHQQQLKAHPQYHVSIPLVVPPTHHHQQQQPLRDKEAPQFRLPFQESNSSASSLKMKSESPSRIVDDETKIFLEKTISNRVSSAVDPHHELPSGKMATNSISDTTTTINAAPVIDSEDDGDPKSTSKLISSQQADNVHGASNSGGSNNKDDDNFFSTSGFPFSSLKDIPPQLPLPDEPIPIPPTNQSFRASSRKGSSDHTLPRSSIVHALSVLRNIPRSPRDSPMASPRNSISSASGERSSRRLRQLSNSGTMIRKSQSPQKFGGLSQPFQPLQEPASSSQESELPSTYYSPRGLSTKESQKEFVDKIINSHSISNEESLSSKSEVYDDFEEKFTAGLLNIEEIQNGKFRMEPLLIPRKLYLPYPTVSIKAFCEFMYTGQVGNKWLLQPTTLDCLAMSKLYNAPLLYDLISEVLYGIIGRKETYIIHESRRCKEKYFRMCEVTGTIVDPNLKFPLDEYEGLMDTIDDGYLDIALLKKSSDKHKRASVDKIQRQKGKQSFSNLSLSTLPDEKEDEYAGLDSSKYSSSSNSSKNKLNSSKPLPKEPRSHSAEPEEMVSPRSKGTAASDGVSSEEIDANHTDNTDNTESDASSISSSDSEHINQFELGDHTKNAQIWGNGVGPRSKSAFDKSFGEWGINSGSVGGENIPKEEDDRDTMVTIDQLVSFNSPVPSDHTIDAIYAKGVITGDMKLMLRSVNVKLMSELLDSQKKLLSKLIDKLEILHSDQVSLSNKSESSLTGVQLHPSGSSTSLHSMNSTRTEATGRFPRLSSLTPFSKKGGTPPLSNSHTFDTGGREEKKGGFLHQGGSVFSKKKSHHHTLPITRSSTVDNTATDGRNPEVRKLTMLSHQLRRTESLADESKVDTMSVESSGSGKKKHSSIIKKRSSDRKGMLQSPGSAKKSTIHPLQSLASLSLAGSDPMGAKKKFSLFRRK